MTCAHHTTLRCLSSLLIFTRRLCRGASAPPFADEVLLLVEAAQVVFFGEAGCLAESGFAVGAAESGFAIGTVLLAGSATRKCGPSSSCAAWLRWPVAASRRLCTLSSAALGGFGGLGLSISSSSCSASLIVSTALRCSGVGSAPPLSPKLNGAIGEVLGQCTLAWFT